MKKRTFLLIELMVALSILSLCLLPLAREPMVAWQESLRLGHLIALHHLADKEWAEVLTRLYTHEIPPESLRIKKKGLFLYRDIPCQTALPTGACHSWLKSCTLTTQKAKGSVYFVECAITFRKVHAPHAVDPMLETLHAVCVTLPRPTLGS
jgi:hypothetical protein